jgi:hypothetical protein
MPFDDTVASGFRLSPHLICYSFPSGKGWTKSIIIKYPPPKTKTLGFEQVTGLWIATIEHNPIIGNRESWRQAGNPRLIGLRPGAGAVGHVWAGVWTEFRHIGGGLCLRFGSGTGSGCTGGGGGWRGLIVRLGLGQSRGHGGDGGCWASPTRRGRTIPRQDSLAIPAAIL